MSIRVTAYSIEIGQQQRLEIAQGEDREFRLTFTDPTSGSARDMTSAQAITLTVRSRTTGIEIFSRLYSGFQGAATAGTPRFQILAADASSEADGPYDCFVEWTDASGYVEQLLVESTFEILPNAIPSSVTSPPGVPVVYGLNWYTGYTGSWWTSLTGGYAPNDAVIAYDGSLGATAVSSFRCIASGVTYFPINSSLIVSSGWQYVGQHGGGITGPTGPAGAGSSGSGSSLSDVPLKTTGYSAVVGDLVRVWPSGGGGTFAVYLPTSPGDIVIKHVGTGSSGSVAITTVGVDLIDGATGPLWMNARDSYSLHRSSGYADWMVI